MSHVLPNVRLIDLMLLLGIVVFVFREQLPEVIRSLRESMIELKNGLRR